MDKSEPIFKPTIILLEGIIYKLKKADVLDTTYPCALCDLSFLCRENYLFSLCQPRGYDAGWYFSESWDDADKTLRELAEAND